MADISWTISLDSMLYQDALKRALLEDRDLEQVLQHLLREWVESPSSAFQVHVVRYRDSLAQIAARYYGDAKLYLALAKYNGLEEPTLIRVGQRIWIPPQSRLPPVPAPVEERVTWEELQVEFTSSPHYNQRPAEAQIWAIVIHATANSSLEGVISWFTNPASLVSAHYNIGQDGRIVQMVSDEQRAWHAGKSEWKNVGNVNDFSIGIELVNRNDGCDSYPNAQYQACIKLCRYLVDKYNIDVGDVVGHSDISLSGKNDPMGLDLEQLRRDIAAV